MPSYPLSFPTEPALYPLRVAVTQQHAQTKAKSPFTKSTQIYDWGGKQWVGSITMQKLDREMATIFGAFIDELDGMNGTFTLDLDPWTVGKTPGAVTFRLARPATDWSADLAVEWNFQIDIEEDV